ncbi:hypothetical protein [Arenimonas fontis]|uniref:Lipoprotein n=1 Tax=Arenimonas fontis TaxID=2608255 RepID=A0A5B2ZBA3_9GAMM|nr:hypothetical protein [Arenimonas fontis]KAA2285958.1 hypothetical protein F0415_00165 [Arenimonas fontis]
MKRFLVPTFLVLALAATPAAARVDRLEPPQQITVVGPGGSTPRLEDVREAVITAGIPRGWHLVEDQPGRAVLRNVIRGKHTVVVAVVYDQSSFRIEYVSSENLNYREKRGKAYIHPKYFQWTNNLAQDIRLAVASP